MTERDLAALSQRLGLTFQNVGLLRQALTHRSANSANNERLEFLGDAVLGFVVAEALYRRFDVADEGVLSRLRAALVNQTALAQIARELGLGDYLILGTGELKSGGFRRDSILSDAFEALLGAVYLDQGLEAVNAWITEVLRARFDDLSEAAWTKDPKTRLQEMLQARGVELPSYVLLSTTGLQHEQQFCVQCTVSMLDGPSRGVGSSRKRAEQAAAAATLERLANERGWK